MLDMNSNCTRCFLPLMDTGKVVDTAYGSYAICSNCQLCYYVVWIMIDDIPQMMLTPAPERGKPETLLEKIEKCRSVNEFIKLLDDNFKE